MWHYILLNQIFKIFTKRVLIYYLTNREKVIRLVIIDKSILWKYTFRSKQNTHTHTQNIIFGTPYVQLSMAGLNKWCEHFLGNIFDKCSTTLNLVVASIRQKPIPSKNPNITFVSPSPEKCRFSNYWFKNNKILN